MISQEQFTKWPNRFKGTCFKNNSQNLGRSDIFGQWINFSHRPVLLYKLKYICLNQLEKRELCPFIVFPINYFKYIYSILYSFEYMKYNSTSHILCLQIYCQYRLRLLPFIIIDNFVKKRQWISMFTISSARYLYINVCMCL